MVSSGSPSSRIVNLPSRFDKFDHRNLTINFRSVSDNRCRATGFSSAGTFSNSGATGEGAFRPVSSKRDVSLTKLASNWQRCRPSAAHLSTPGLGCAHTQYRASDDLPNGPATANPASSSEASSANP